LGPGQEENVKRKEAGKKRKLEGGEGGKPVPQKQRHRDRGTAAEAGDEDDDVEEYRREVHSPTLEFCILIYFV
jgi:hypothetical protein